MKAVCTERPCFRRGERTASRLCGSTSTCCAPDTSIDVVCASIGASAPPRAQAAAGAGERRAPIDPVRDEASTWHGVRTNRMSEPEADAATTEAAAPEAAPEPPAPSSAKKRIPQPRGRPRANHTWDGVAGVWVRDVASVTDADLRREIGAYLRSGASWDDLTDKSVRSHLEATLLPGHAKNVLKPRKQVISDAIEAARVEILAERAKAEARAAAKAAGAGGDSSDEEAAGAAETGAAPPREAAEAAAAPSVLPEGTVCWGKYSTWPHWPALIVPLLPKNEGFKGFKKELAKTGGTFVRFFGSNDHAVCGDVIGWSAGVERGMLGASL